ncbi:MAG: penicillin-binding transpeptidase domain-containing protein, partial [Gammaproteobacteria bacterium]|nr:penicillin-binding transpeptidase domain-containing protein [Gammaproteobacteria bacterium]
AELRLDQLALLVALVKGASFYNPRNHPERALDRRNLVLQLMFEQGYINEQEYHASIHMPLDLARTPGWSRAKYPAFVELVKRQLERDYRQEDLRTEGLRIFTTLNPLYQEIAERAVRQRLVQLEKSGNRQPGSIQPAVVISSVETGEILALIGGRDEDKAGFNRALDASRPIGSLIKPVVYLTALLYPDKFNLLSRLQDTPVELQQSGGRTWSPENYDGKVHGQVTLHRALEQSYNLATVRLGMSLGMDTFKSTLKKLGVTRNIPEYPSVFLGAIEFTPFEVMQIYQVLASNGFRIPPRAIREVLDREGKPLQRYPLEISTAVDSRAVYLVNYLLTRVVQYGTARALSSRMPHYMPYAGKTGTTNDLRDSWFAGFGENILAVIWLGKDDNTPTGLTGSSGALQVWTDIMQEIKPEPLSMIPPDGVRMVPIRDRIRVRTDCPGSERFPFIEPYIPAEQECPEQKPDRETSGESPWSILDIFR